MDKDLQAKQEARDLSRQAGEAQKELFFFAQEKLDTIVEAVARAFEAAAPELAHMAVEETGFGNVEDKITKNRFASKTVLEAMYAMDAALKAADVKLCKLYNPPSETNFGGGLLSGTQSACTAACAAFADAVAEVAGRPK